MSKGIEAHEKSIKTVFADKTELNFTRPVRYGDERQGEATEKYIVVYPITYTAVGITYPTFEDQEAPEVDIIQQLISPVELSFGLEFIGGNARGELSVCLINLAQDPDVQEAFFAYDMNFTRNSGIRDISAETGGILEQRAEADIFFYTHLKTSEKVIRTIQNIEVGGKLDYIDKEVADFTAKITS